MVDAPVSPLTIRADQTELTELQLRSLNLNIREGNNGPSTDEQMAFIHTVVTTGLDPYRRMIMLQSRWNSGARRTTWSVYVNIDGLRTIAHSTGDYVGLSSFETYHKTTGAHLSTTVTVRRLVKGIVAEFSATAWMEEYVQKDKKGSVTTMWVQFRHLMLAKCAEALALRMAFASLLAGLYTPDEMGQASNRDDDDQTEQPTHTQQQQRRQTSHRTEPDVAPQDVVWPEPKPRPEPAPVPAPSPTTRWDFDDSMRTLDGVARESDVVLIRATWMALSHRTLLATPVTLDASWSELYSKITGNTPVDVEYLGKLVAAVALWTKANSEALYPDLEPAPESTADQVVIEIADQSED
jgi:phage recombination protein Bet